LDAARGHFSEQGYFSTKDQRHRETGACLLRDYLCGLRRQARAPEHSDGQLLQSAHRFYHARPRRLGRSCRNPSDGRGYTNVREEFGDIMRVLLATAPHDTPMAASGMDVEQVSSRRLTSCGFISAVSASSLCANENGWSYERAERWLGAQATWALLRNHPLC